MRVFCKSWQTFTNTKASSSINQPRATHRIAVLSSHACVLYTAGKLLQIQKHHHQSTNREQHIASQCCHLMRVFCIRPANFYKYKSIINQPTESNTSHHSVVSHACVLWTACKLLQIQKHHHQSTNRTQHIVSQCCHLMRVFCIRLANFTNTKASSINQPSATHRITVLSLMRVFCIRLANFYKYNRIIINQPTGRNQTPKSPI
jgi:hypothetical protein